MASSQTFTDPPFRTLRAPLIPTPSPQLARSLYDLRLVDGERPAGIPEAELSAALGYLLNVVDLVAKYLGCPLLHEVPS